MLILDTDMHENTLTESFLVLGRAEGLIKWLNNTDFWPF